MKKNPIQVIIPESELSSIQELREKAKTLAEDLKILNKQLAEAEKSVIKQLGEGAVCRGAWNAIVNVETVTGRSAPKWKEEYVAHMVAEHHLKQEDIEESMKNKYPAKTGLESVLLIVPKS